MHPKPAGSQQEFPFRFWKSLVRSHRPEPVSTALCARQHLPKRHGQFGGTKGRTEVRRLAKGSGVPWSLVREVKNPAQFQREWVSDTKLIMLHHLWWKKNKFILFWAKRKGYLQAFSIQLFHDETIIVKLLIQKYSFWKCQSKIFWVL